jgi:hypothetical protein
MSPAKPSCINHALNVKSTIKHLLSVRVVWSVARGRAPAVLLGPPAISNLVILRAETATHLAALANALHTTHRTRVIVL